MIQLEGEKEKKEDDFSCKSETIGTPGCFRLNIETPNWTKKRKKKERTKIRKAFGGFGTACIDYTNHLRVLKR